MDASTKTPLSPLVVMDRSAPNRFSSYLLEILEVEGYVTREVLDLSQSPLDPRALAGRDVVILADVALNAQGRDALAAFVAGGGKLLASRPPRELAGLFGLQPSVGINKRVRDRYLHVERQHALAAGFPDPVLQYHGESDLYQLAGAQPLAWIAGDFEHRTDYPAVTTFQHEHGGKTAMFAFDLAASTVAFHQGRPENASDGAHADSDADDRWIPSDLFVGQLDSRLKFVPQADLHQDLLVRLLNWMSGAPLPRLWYFPHGTPAIAYVNGDSDEMVLDDYLKVIETVERYGGRYTLYLLKEHFPLVEPHRQKELQARGHCLGNHLELDWQTSIEDGLQKLSEDFEGFTQRYGYRPLTNRGHCLIWPGWTDMARALADAGVKMDQNFIPRRFYRHGYINGSALPVKFMDCDGQIIDLYEQNTQITDDGSEFDEKFLVSGCSRQEVLDTARRMLDECIDTYHGVFQPSFHPHLTAERVMWLLEALVEQCWARNVPMVGGDEWVEFNEARRAVRFEQARWDRDALTLSFRVEAGLALNGLPLLLPALHDGAFLTAIERDGEPAVAESRFFKSTRYALLDLDLPAKGAARITARYQRRSPQASAPLGLRAAVSTAN